jgi:hypothetical protein
MRDMAASFPAENRSLIRRLIAIACPEPRSGGAPPSKPSGAAMTQQAVRVRCNLDRLAQSQGTARGMSWRSWNAAPLPDCQRRLVTFLTVCCFAAYTDRVNVSFAALTMNEDLGLSAPVSAFQLFHLRGAH